MKKCTTLRSLKQSFQRILPASDGRMKLSPVQFVSGLVCCFLGDSKSFGLESIRRFMMSQFEVTLSRGAFWERLSGRRLNRMLEQLLNDLMSRFCAEGIGNQSMRFKLGVQGIDLLDSSSMTLWDGAKKSYPGTWTTAAIKWHACIDLLSGQLRWFKLTPGSTHDRQGFPPLASRSKRLIIFDLGYWDYGLLLAIDAVEGYFLSRVKTNSTIRIRSVVEGVSERWIGSKLSALKPKRKLKKIVELGGEVIYKKEKKLFRVIGFWNTNDKKYHWYVTNLSVSASLLYPLYRLRWALELIFKSSKRSFNLDQRCLTSNNHQIIQSLVLSSIIACFASQAVLSLGAKTLTEQQKLALSFQRAAHVVVQLAADFIAFLTRSRPRFESQFMDKIRLFSQEIFEKNHHHRETSLSRVNSLLNG